MNYVLQLSIVFILLLHLNVAIYVIPNTILTQSGGSYTAMLVDDDENIKPKQCYLSDNIYNTYEINLTTPGVGPLEPKNTVRSVEKNTNIITSLGNGICGFKLDNVDGNNYTRTWNISFVDKNDKFYFKTVNVVLKDLKPENKTQYVRPGDRFSIYCGSSVEFDRYLFTCQLYDPLGALVISNHVKPCNYIMEISKMSDFGRWKCVLHFTNNMSPRNVYYNILEKEKVNINLWQNETNTHVNIGCSISHLDNYASERTYCEMIRPDGEIFVVKEGLATDRYTALGTNTSEGICGLEIKKPLEEFEKGLWSCAYNNIIGQNGNWYPIGGFINVSNGSSTMPPPQAVIPKQIVTLINEGFSITCQVPYSSSYCYMRGPRGNTVYPVNNDLETTIGLCKFTKEKATKEDNGTWSCGFAKKSGEVDDVYNFEVLVLDKYTVKPENKVVVVPEGSNAYLKCSTKDLGDYPIQYCRFENDYRQIYNIYPEEISSNRMSYYGRGFKYGDCGMEIKAASWSDAGNWTCITRAGNNFQQPEVYSYLMLNIN